MTDGNSYISLIGYVINVPSENILKTLQDSNGSEIKSERPK